MKLKHKILNTGFLFYYFFKFTQSTNFLFNGRNTFCISYKFIKKNKLQKAQNRKAFLLLSFSLKEKQKGFFLLLLLFMVRLATEILNRSQ